MNDILKLVIPNNKFFYDWERRRVENNPRKWRHIFFDSLLPGYVHDNRWEIMRTNKFPIAIPEGKVLSNEGYDNDHRTKPIILGKWKYGHHPIHKIDSRDVKKNASPL